MHEGFMIRSRKSQALWAISLAVILVLHVLFLMPFTLYTGNPEEFAIFLPNILKHYALVGVTLISVLGLLGAALPQSAFRAYSVFLAAICSLLWIQGNILVWDYGLMDGRAIDWAEATWRGWLDSALWIGVLLGVFLFRRRLEKPILYVAVATFVLPLTASVILGIQNASDLRAKSAESPSADAIKEVYRFSSKQNVLHIIMDGFQSDVFEELLNEEGEGRRLASALEGFVFFKENIGAFRLTHMSIPAILSGKIYRNHIPRHDFLEEGVGGKTIVNAAYDAGYEVDLVFPLSLFEIYMRSKHTNAYAVPRTDHLSARDYELDESAKLIDLSVFRMAPHFLKEYVYNDQLWLFQSFLVDSGYKRLRFFAHNAFLRRLRDNMTADRPAPVYKLLHLMLSHYPMVANENCEYAGRVLKRTRATVKVQARCSLGNVVRLLEGMKELGVYDDALIVLMADHGAGVPPRGLRGYVTAGGKRVIMDKKTVAMALPVLAIKRPGVTGPFEVSPAPSAITDTPATIASVLGLKEQFDGRSVFSLRPDARRERRYHHYRYVRSEWTAEYLNPIEEFIINGSALDSRAWRRGDRFHPKGAVNAR
jgi:hypothetical protein